MSDPAAQSHRSGGLTAAAGGAGERAPEPTLPELVRSSRFGPAIAVGIALVLVAVVALLLVGRGEGFSYSGDEAPPFSVAWGSEMERVGPSGDELVRLEGSDGEARTYFAVSPLPDGAIPAAAEDEPLPALALAAGADARSRTAGGDSRVALEGRTELAVDRGPDAYQTAFVADEDGADDGVLIVKRFLVPDPDRPGEGVAIEIGEATSSARVAEKVADAPAGFFLNWPIQLLLEDAASVRTADGLEEPLRSFEFG